MNLMRKFLNARMLTLIILAVTLSPLGVFGQDPTESQELKDLLPQYSSFKWVYHGSVEYGHDMEIESIVKGQNSTHYFIEGHVHDMSDGESDMDFSLSLEYLVHSDVIVQTKTEEVMLDSEYDEIELIRTPLEKGTTWTQEVENAEGSTILESTIIEVEDTDKGRIFTVRYEDTGSDYYEERRIQEGVGVVYFEKLMFFESDSYPMMYSIYEEGTGVEMDISFHDVTGQEWFIDHISKLVMLDLIEGYPDGSFRPGGQITVAEFIKVTVESLSHYQVEASGAWFGPYVSKAIEIGLITEGEFEDFSRPITREEMTKIIVRASGEAPQNGQLNFADSAKVGPEFAPYIYTAVELGIIRGYPEDNTFRPDRTSTRAEASKLFAILVEKMIHMEDFSENDALALDSEFEIRLYQETEGDNWVVRDFDSKEDLVEYISEIADPGLAKEYVDSFYEYMDGELVLPPVDGIITIIEDRDYQLKMIHPRKYQLTQKTTTEMVGQYTLTITYRYEMENWIIKDRDLEVHEIS